MMSVVLQTPRGGFEIPTDAHGRLWVHFAEPAKLSGPGEPSRLYVSASDVLKGRIGKERLQGRLVIVGTSAAGLQDIRNTPIAGRPPGVEVHPNLPQTIDRKRVGMGKRVSVSGHRGGGRLLKNKQQET